MAQSTVWPLAKVFPRISSFEKNPDRSGTPAIARVPVKNVQYVMGSSCFKPPMRRRSCSPWSA